MARTAAVVVVLLLASAALAAAGSSSSTSQCTAQRPGMLSRNVVFRWQAVGIGHHCGRHAVRHLIDCALMTCCTAGLALTLYRYKPELFPQSGGFNVNSPFNVRCFLVTNSSNVSTASAVSAVSASLG